MNKRKTRFEIEVLQRAKIIMACEAVAVNTSVIIGIYLTKTYIPKGFFQDFLIILGGLFGICYALYASIGNFNKHKKIRELVKKI